MRDSVNRIYTEIKSDQKEYKIAFHCKMRHLPVVMDHSVFASLNSKITYSAMALISYELNSAKINIEKFNQHIFLDLSLATQLLSDYLETVVLANASYLYGLACLVNVGFIKALLIKFPF